MGAIVLVLLLAVMGVAQEAPDEVVVGMAVDAAANELQVPIESLVVLAVEERDWADASLGCPAPDRVYAQVITPGYLVTIQADDGATEVLVHTDGGRRAVICSTTS